MSLVRQRERQAILNALRAGVVPGRGLEHLQVGRAAEVEALANDIRTVKDGGTAVRFLMGEYGSGKSFFLQVIRHAAQRAGCVTMHADIAQDARLYGTGGRVRSLFSTLVGSTGTRTQPDGGAMAEVLERFVSTATEQSRKLGTELDHVIRYRLVELKQYRGGHEFADVVLAYSDGVQRNDDDRREAALRWIRGEYRTKTEARDALGIRGVIGHADLYPSLRLLATLVSKAGYGGLIVQLDELAVLARLSAPTRVQNYEQILTMLNSLLGGAAQHLMMVFAGTPEFVLDETRGLASYGALRQRLSANKFLRPGLRDTASPVIELEQLSVEDLWVLLENVHRIYCSNGQRDPLPERDAALKGFLEHADGQLGGLEGLTPREATRSWLHFLDVLDQNRSEDWRRLLDDVSVGEDHPDEPSDPLPDEEFSALLPLSG
jgi:hypothetical protein